MADQIPSPDQQAIIDNKTENILVPAAAGSGKTTVMIQRIITKIIEDTKDDSIPEDKKHSLDSILVVTFTVAAAEHMRQKAEAELNKAIADNKNDPELVKKLNRQKDLLPNSYIQTFDSFCARVITEKGYCAADSDLADVFDPANVVLDDHEKAILKNAAVRKAVKQMYAAVKDENDAFIKLTQRFGDGRSDKSLMEAAVAIFDRLRSLPRYTELIRSEVDKRKACDESGKLVYADKMAVIAGDVIDYLSRKKNEMESSGGLLDLLELNPEMYLIKIEKKGKCVVDLSNEASKDFVRQVISLIDSQIERYEADPGEDGFDQVFRIIDEWGNLWNIYGVAPTPMNKQLKYCRENPELTEEFYTQYESIKAIANLFFQKPQNPKMVLRSAPGELVKLFAFLNENDREGLLALQKERTEAIGAMVELVIKLDKCYAELKANVRGMDFSDQEYAAFDILDSEDAAKFYQDKFVEIYIDEYQDNTRLQDEIISKVSRKEGNVFRVGDVKQSIYRFRHAEPAIFNEKIDQYKADNTIGKVLPLTENYRSSPQILAFVNHIFEQTMTRDAAEIDYGLDQRLNHPEKGGADDQGEAGLPKVVIVDSEGAGNFEGIIEELVDPEDEGIPANTENMGSSYETFGSGDPGDSEVQILDGKIKALCLGVEKEVREYMSQFDPNSDDYISHYGDICVLTTIKNEAQVISDYLNAHGLPSTGKIMTSIFGDLDIRGIINCIICLGNSLRDEYLAGVLLAPYKNTNFTVNELATVQAFIVNNASSYRKAYLFQKIRKYAEMSTDDLAIRFRAFIEWYDNLRMKAMTCDIDEIIELIYKRTDIKATVARNKGDFEKLIIFKDWMCSNFKRFGCDISGIAEELENMKIQIDTAAIETDKSEKNSITCMNFHKSKGLEYPFIIFALKDRGSKDHVPSAGYDPKFGFIFEDYNIEKVTRSKSIDQLIYTFDSVLAENAEVLRNLYVALTRAKTRLSIVTWDTEDGGSAAIKAAASAADQARGNTFKRLDWLSGSRTMCCDLFMSLMRTDSVEAGKIRNHSGVENAELLGFKACTTKNNQEPGFLAGNKGYTVEIYDRAQTRQLDMESGKHLKERVKDKDEKDPVDDLFDKEGNIIFMPYEYEDETRIPFKVSVTGIKHGNIEETRHVDLEVPSLSDFENVGNGKLTAASKGTVLHKLMRFIDTSKLREDPESFDAEIESLIADRIFAEYSDENIRGCAAEFRSGILAFASSDVCIAADEADLNGKADREKHLVFAVPASVESSRDVALVQGIIDLVYEDESGWTIVDYKTDRFGDKETKEERAAQSKERHAFQLNSYAAAYEAAGRKVSKKYLYLVRYGEFVEV